MKQTPRACVEKWEDRRLQVLSMSEGCILVEVDNEAIEKAGSYNKNPLKKPIVSYKAQREILIALIHKNGGAIII